MSEEKQIITLVTGNSNKLKEIISILSDGKADNEGGLADIGDFLLVNRGLDLEEVQGTLESVTIHKAKSAAKIIKGPVIVEDTGLVFNALNGLPGPYIKWFVKQAGLQNLITMLSNFDDKSAQAITTIGYCEGPDSDVQLFQGKTDGTIVEVPRGTTVFGWDAIFQPLGYEQTYAEMDKKLKNTLSQRYKAFDKLKAKLCN